MTPDQWTRLEELFHQAAEMDPSARASFLDAECQDAELRAELDQLLSQDEAGGGRLARAIQEEAGAMAADGSSWLIGKRVGAYRVTDIIGEGGMGTVYRAVRDDDEYHKQVALKVVRRGFETSQLLERFRSERQILAMLDHPYIARMLDGGATADGLPYLVMELVEGVPVTRWAAEHGLDIKERLRLFQQICEAVHYAHANLVVHRDIKPGNIFITQAGVPKLLDFGIAKLTGPAKQIDVTRTIRLITPAYASPEQVRGEAVTTATDVYSLGVVLYELLTGHSPQRLDNPTPGQIEQAICTTIPPRPSESGELADVPRRALAGDLDDIVMMALRKEPERRYRSVEQLSADIGRHLAGLPVMARADTISYRAGKFVRRNRVWIGAAALVVISLAGGIIVARVQAQRAERRFNQVRSLAKTVLFDIYDGIENLPGSTPIRQKIVSTGLEYLASLSAESRGDPALQEELAAAYRRIGDVQGDPLGPSLGDAKGALESYRRALDLARSAAVARPEYDNEFGYVLIKVGQRQFANNDLPGARQSFTEAVHVLVGALAREPANKLVLERLSAASSGLGRILEREGDQAGAIQESARGVEISRRVLALEPKSETLRDNLAGALATYGGRLLFAGQPENALPAYRESVRLREELARDFPGNARHLRLLMIGSSHLGDVLGSPGTPNIGDFSGARVQFDRMLQIAATLAAADPASKTGQNDLAQAHTRMAILLEEAEPHTALAHYRQALDILGKLSAAQPNTDSSRAARWACEFGIGSILYVQGKPREAIAWLRQALATKRPLLDLNPKDSTNRVQWIRNFSKLSLALARTGDRTAVDANAAEVEVRLQNIRTLQVAKHTPARLAQALDEIGEAYAILKDQAKACEWYGRSITAWREYQSGSGLPQQQKPLQAKTVQPHAACPAAQ